MYKLIPLLIPAFLVMIIAGTLILEKFQELSHIIAGAL